MYGIARSRPLRPAELTHVTAVIRWLRKQPIEVHADPAQGRFCKLSPRQVVLGGATIHEVTVVFVVLR